MTGWRVALAAGWLCALAAPAPAGVPVILDTDIGSWPDDAYALALAVASPELELVAVTTVGGATDDRAWLACRFLTQVDVKGVPVAAGAPPQPRGDLDWQVQYRRHPAAVYNRTAKPAKEPAAELIYAKLKERPGELTLVCLGPLTNAARLLKDHPDAKPLVKRIVLMGGSVAVGYTGRPPAEPEWNVKADIPAAKAVLASGVPLTVVPLDAGVTLGPARQAELFAAHTPLTYQVQNLDELSGHETPTLYDPPAVAAAFSDRFLTVKELRLEVADDGMTRAVEGKPNARVVTGIDRDGFVKWMVDRVRSVGAESLPAPPGNPSRLIDPGAFPVRVHVAEDYDTDIEKRWWMCGKPETRDVPPGGRRACRAVLTQDFDDKQGDTRTMYRAVIFNPVPGPPVGPRTRLRFKYKLAGTGTLRVQLYSLTNGYHRYLAVSGLRQNEWADGCVDLTAMRRPDGTGGPLAAGERIDDIQFYVDPRAELLIDDIVLYEAAAEGETRPFPKRIVFTAWFDTGRQGREWPGDFAIVPHEKPRTGKAAKAVPGPGGAPWVRLGLRGERRLDANTELFFSYWVSGAKAVEVELYHAAGKRSVASQRVPLIEGQWGGQATARFTVPADSVIDEVRFRLPAGADLLLDDVLLDTPGR